MLNIFLTKKCRGTAVLEMALTFPVICCLIFFILEFIKINDVQMSVDSIAMEMAFDFMASKKTSNFSAIITRHKPSFIPSDKITWYFAVYSDLATMNSTIPYGGEEVYWPDSIGGISSANDYIDSDRDNIRRARAGALTNITNYRTPETSFSPTGSTAGLTLSGKAFVLTVVCDYPFSSFFVKKFFAAGGNTKDKGKFIIWGRCIGVCS